MYWSHSSAKQFNQCQRRWFYSQHVAHHAAKRDIARREAYLLKQMQSVYAWRGELVDKVLSERVIPELNQGRNIGLAATLRSADELFHRQCAYAQAHRVRRPGFTKKGAGDDFAAWLPIECGETVSSDQLERAWSDIEQALTAFFEMAELWTLMNGAEYLVAQHAFSCQRFGLTIRAKPDLIAFHRQRAPLIIDWKVHTFDNRDAKKQLVTYAWTLLNSPPRKDIVVDLSQFDVSEIQLIEVQLLSGVMRHYRTDTDEFERLEDEIWLAADAMQRAVGSDPKGYIPQDFPMARNARYCLSCPFRKPCAEAVDEIDSYPFHQN